MKSLFASILLLFASAVWAGSVSIENAYVRHMPPTQKVTGAFMTLKNDSAENRAAVSAESEVAETAELHTHIHENGMMKMRQVDKIDIVAGSETVLEPGSFHVMLIGLKQPLELGQMVAITLNFDDGSSTQVQAEVKTVMSGMKMSDKPMERKKMEHAEQGMEHAGKKMDQ